MTGSELTRRAQELRFEEKTVVRMLADLLRLPADQQMVTLAVVIRAWIARAEGHA